MPREIHDVARPSASDAAAWLRIKDIYGDAVELEPAGRRAFLDSACGDDADLRRQVESLLRAVDDAGDFLSGAANDASGGGSHFLAAASEPARDFAPAERSGARIDKYVLGEQLGEGGFGTVFRAEQVTPVRRAVAFKIVRLGMDTRRVVARFEAERQALALMDHPGIARVFDAGATDAGRPYFVMELVTGRPITEYCRQRGLSVLARLELFVQVCQAVQHAHQKGIIHRDLKPANILVGDGPLGAGAPAERGPPCPKVIDFGIAKALEDKLSDATLTGPRQLIGTPAYMAPEQTGGGDVDTRADVYSLGVVLFELLAGHPPLDAAQLNQADYAELLRIIREVDPPRLGQIRPALRGDLDWIVARCLEKDRERRYASVAELADDVRRHLCDEPVHASPPSTSYRLFKWLRRHRTAALAGALVLIATLLGVGGLSFGLLQAARQRDRAVAAEASERVQRVEAERSGAQARATSRFLEDMLTSADPGQTEGKAITVREVLDAAAEKLTEETQRDPAAMAVLHRTIGRTYMNLGEYARATPQLERALEVYTGLAGPRAIETVRARQFLADNLVLAGDLQRAEQLVDESMEDLRAGDPDDPALLARHLLARGRIGKMRNDYAAAATDLHEAADLFRRVGSEDGVLARTLGELGNVLMRTGDYGAAENQLSEAIDLARRAGREPDVAGLQSNLAIVYRRLGRVAEAEARYRDVLAAQTRLHGPDHPLTLSTRVNLAVALIDQASYAEAEALLRGALDPIKAVHGAESFQFASATGLLGRVLQAQQRFAEATDAAQTALDAFEAALGPRHDYVATALLDLGACQRQAGELDAAEASFQRALEIYGDIHGQGHPLAARALESLGECRYLRGRSDDGAALYQRAEAVYIAAGENATLELGECRAEWAQREFDAGRTAEAEQLLRLISESDQAPTGPGALRNQILHVRCLIARGQPDLAESLLLQAFERRDELPPTKARGLWSAIAEMMAYLEGEGDAERAAHWQERDAAAPP